MTLIKDPGGSVAGVQVSHCDGQVLAQVSFRDTTKAVQSESFDSSDSF